MTPRQNGFSVVEILIAVGIAGVFISFITIGLVQSVRAAKDAGRENQAIFLAREGLSAAQNIRDEDFADLADGTWGLDASSGVWQFSGSSDTTGIFTRSVTVSSVSSTDKQVESAISWTGSRGAASSVSLVSRLTEWMAETLVIWTSAAVSAILDLSGNQDGLKVAASGDYAYLILSNNGSSNFIVIDVSTPSSPSLVTSISLSGKPTNIAVSDDYAYVSSTENSQELQVVDISAPSSPSLVGSYDASGSADANGVAVSGSYAYLARKKSSSVEFLVIDVSNPLVPTLSGSSDHSDTLNDVVVEGNYAYLATDYNSQELQIMNVSNPAAPTLIGGYDTTGSTNASAVAVSGADVFLGVDSTLYALDDSTHGAPSLSGTYATSDSMNDLAFGSAQAPFLFAAVDSAASGATIIDVSNPAAMTTFAILNTVGTPYGITYSPDVDAAFVADADNAGEFVVITGS